MAVQYISGLMLFIKYQLTFKVRRSVSQKSWRWMSTVYETSI